MPIYEMQKDAAAHFDITSSALRQWMKRPGFPDCSRGYDTDAIEAFQQTHNLKGSKIAEQAQTLKLAKLAGEVREQKAKADRLERLEEEARGNILRRDEMALASTEAITLTRDRLTAIPQSLCRLVPKKYHQQLRDEGRRLIKNILDEFARLYATADND